jgi:UDP-N-acetylmuramyl pentapeptide phosphotransferase/UDP-N-acetylglucosamine-1-phosphate transferase
MRSFSNTVLEAAQHPGNCGGGQDFYARASKRQKANSGVRMKGELSGFWAAGGPVILAASALLSTLLILALHPLLKRYAMAQPNARSSHKIPTPQGGGIAVVITVIAVSYAAFFFLPSGAAAMLRFSIVSAAVVLMAGVGVIADIHPENVASRLLLQALAVAAVILVLPPGLRVVPALPLPLERIGLIVGGLWFVNLVNFMDGLDWMTVAEVAPITAALAGLGLIGALPAPTIAVSLALCGAIIGFAYFNRPVARLFLGDVGSLPVGLILGWLLILLAGEGGRAAAILLPLYYLADSTITLVRRAVYGEKIWQAHRSHYYQRATDRGFTVLEVVVRVFAINVVLAALAFVTTLFPSSVTSIATLFCGAALVGGLLVTFERGKR